MAHYAETRTVRKDGSEVVWRQRASGKQEALNLAYSIACEIWNKSLPKEFPKWCEVNMFGEMVYVETKEYGSSAQVSEGVFIL